jgi:hypothetical protein
MLQSIKIYKILFYFALEKTILPGPVGAVVFEFLRTIPIKSTVGNLWVVSYG